MKLDAFERVYQRYDDGKEVRLKVTRLSDGDYQYELPGKFSHVCDDRECPDADRLALLFLED
jgi:hypothetical protein